MGYESAHSAAARLRLIHNSTRDHTLRHMLACALDHALASGTTSMSIHSSGVTPSVAQSFGYGNGFPAGPMVTAETDLRTTPRRDPWETNDTEESWFPTDHLWAALATPAFVRDAVDAVSAQSRALADILAAHRSGAVPLPPDLLAGLESALAAGRRVTLSPAS